MKYRILIIVIAICMSGCSVLNRSAGSSPQEDDNWKRQGGVIRYQCSDKSISVGHISKSNLAIMGPLIPLIPIWRTDPQALHMEVVNSQSCPSVTFSGTAFEAIETTNNRSSTYCRYRFTNIDITVPVSLVVTKSELSCEVPPVLYKPEVKWFYMPIASA